MKTIILTPIAERDIYFYLDTADELQRMFPKPDLQIVFLSFFQPGNRVIQARGYPVYDPYSSSASQTSTSLGELEKNFEIPSTEKLSLHESLTFGLKNNTLALSKWSSMVPKINELLAQIEKDFPVTRPESDRFILQELAGFIGPLSLFYVGMKRGWNHYFTEPAFFKGRIHFLRNNLFFKVQNGGSSPEAQASVQKYLKAALENKTVVAATKDAHHYRDMGLGKVFNQQNFSKLSKKLISKYVRGEKYEFDHIWNHSRRYLQMLFNRWQNNSSYKTLEQLPAKKIFYFPFHVQLDFSLTIRSPRWLDQLGLIEEILKRLPADSILVAKEHPASIGCLDQKRLSRILSQNNFFLLHPQVNSYDILEKCTAVITINSKVGAEALSKGIPTFSFGKAFYTEEGFAHHFSDWSQLENWLKNPVPNSGADQWVNFLNNVWEQSDPTELYHLEKSNVHQFAAAIAKRLNP